MCICAFMFSVCILGGVCFMCMHCVCMHAFLQCISFMCVFVCCVYPCVCDRVLCVLWLYMVVYMLCMYCTCGYLCGFVCVCCVCVLQCVYFYMHVWGASLPSLGVRTAPGRAQCNSGLIQSPLLWPNAKCSGITRLRFDPASTISLLIRAPEVRRHLAIIS